MQRTSACIGPNIATMRRLPLRAVGESERGGVASAAVGGPLFGSFECRFSACAIGQAGGEDKQLVNVYVLWMVVVC